MDINMPMMDGFEATNAIREHVGRAKTMIIGTSAYPIAQIEAHGHEVGMDSFLSKPVCPLEVARIIERSKSLTDI